MISNNRLTLSIPAVLLFAFACYVIFSVSVGGAIFASDEYAFYISGKFNNQLAALYSLDPGLQRVSNFVYFSLVHISTRLFGEHFLAAYRVLHAIEYLAAVWLIARTVLPVAGAQRMLPGIIACLLFPAHIYLYAVMPEVDLMLLAAILGFALARVYPQHCLRGSVLAGAALGTAILIKPHAVAMLLAALATLPLLWAAGAGPRRLATVLRNGMLMLFTAYVVLIALAFACTGNWSFDPSVALGLKFYGRYLDNPVAQVSVFSRFFSALYYLLGNATVIALIFSPVLVWSASHLVICLRRRSSSTPEKTALAIFVITMVASHLAMTAWFTAGAAALSEGEAMRLHGRYLSAALIWLPALYFFALAELSERAKKATLLLLGAALLLGMFVVIPKFKIFPWDNPLFFAFFNPQNWFQWSFGGALPYIGMLLFVVLIGGLGASIYRRQWLPRILAVQLFLILGVGCLQSYAWLASHLHGTAEISRSGRALGLLLGDKQIGRGVVVSEERYGRASYLLFGLGNAPKVITQAAGARISAQDIAGADWVVLDGDYQLDFDYAASLTVGKMRLIPLQSGSAAIAIANRVASVPVAAAIPAVQRQAGPKTVLSVGEVSPWALAQAPGNGLLLTGFNAPEEWGAWSSETVAEVLLPRLLQGHLRIKLFGWSLDENLKAPLRLKIGDQVQVLSFSNAGKEIELVVNVSKPTDRLIFESGVFKPADSARILGVAISRISVERLPK